VAKEQQCSSESFQVKAESRQTWSLELLQYNNDGGKHASCCAAIGRKVSWSPGVADTDTFSMNTWNTLLESYQQRVYKDTLATVKRKIQQAENPTPAKVISTEAAHSDNAILDYLISEVALQEPEIRSNDPNIPMENNCTDDKLHFGMPGGSEDFKAEGYKGDKSDAIPTTSRRWRAAIEHERFDLETSAVDWYEGNDGDDVDADEEGEASQANDGSTQNLEDWGHSTWDWEHSTRDCEDWTVYFRPVEYDNGEANATASDVSKAKTVL